MARKRKDTFFYDMIKNAMLKIVVSMSKEGMLPSVKMGNFPEFQVYPSRDLLLGDLSCDLACVLGGTIPNKQEMAAEIMKRLESAWAVSPFSEIQQSGPGFIHFRIPAGAVKR